jgi:toxin YoeB
VSRALAFFKQALKNAKKLKAAGLESKAEKLLAILRTNLLHNPPPFEKLVGGLVVAYSRRINIHNRLVYEVFAKEKIVRVLRMWTHYE